MNLVKRLEENYKTIKTLDKEGNWLLVKSFGQIKKFVAHRKEFFKDPIKIQQVMNTFQGNQRYIETLHEQSILKYHEVFIEESHLEKQAKIDVWFIYEEFDYVVNNPYYIGNVVFNERHIIKHFEQNEIFQLLKNLLDLIRIF